MNAYYQYLNALLCLGDSINPVGVKTVYNYCSVCFVQNQLGLRSRVRKTLSGEGSDIAMQPSLCSFFTSFSAYKSNSFPYIEPVNDDPPPPHA